MRTTTLQNLHLFGQTRRARHSYHLAGFHRFQPFHEINDEIAQNSYITNFFGAQFQGAPYRPVGLSDITINRSQHWHTDLLRGRFAGYLDGVNPWQTPDSTCIKALAYLQSGKSLRVVRGSHLQPTPLDDDALDALAQSSHVEQLEIMAGDVVMMDIRTLHRGATEAEADNPALAENPKILIASVFGPADDALSQAMAVGNAHRMAEWDKMHLSDLPAD